MMNRTEQNWPDGEAIAIAEPILSPYVHELNQFGTDCATDCPACLYALELQGGETEDEYLRRTR
jgi:hypothetical protein